MFTFARNLLYKQLNKIKHFSAQEQYRHIIMLAFAFIAAVTHLVFSVFFAFFCLPLTVTHSFGIGVFLIAVYLIRQKRPDVAGVVLSVMILASSYVTIFYIGGNNLSILYQYVVLLMIMLVPSKLKALRYTAAAVLPLIMIGLQALDVLHTPVYPLDGQNPEFFSTMNTALTFINIVISAGGLIILIALQHIITNFIDQYKQKQMTELKSQAYVDALTGLYNRRYAELYLDTMNDADAARQMCIAIADLDDFKNINDTYGHDAGDTTLKVVAKIMRDNVRRSDLVFRWGGEEFVFILHDISPANGRKVLDDIRKLIADTPIHHSENDFKITVTIGFAALDRSNFDASFKMCDNRLYQGKKSGKNVLIG